jgi:hypothetical protein
LSSNAVVQVRVPERFDYPQWLASGGLSILAGDADGAALLTSDLTRFTAQVSTNLVDWEGLNKPLSLTNGTILLTDPGATNYSSRFYRISEQ